MDVIDFIKQDTGRIRREPRRRLQFGIVLSILALGAGLGMRRDLVGLDGGVDDALAIASLVVLTGLLAALPWLYRVQRQWFWLGAATIAVVSSRSFEALPIADGLAPGIAHAAAGSGEFWREAELCFVKGLGTTVAAAVLVGLFAGRLLPTPSPAAQAAAATMPALAGVVMLAAHCPVDDLAHIALGHWAPGVVFWPVAWLIVRLVVRRSVPAVGVAALGELP